jgi:MFS family permease
MAEILKERILPEKKPVRNLWRHADFMKLWVGQTISLTGSQITLLALPLTAALVLQSTPAQMGILSAVEYMPFLLFGMFAGVYLDYVKRRAVLIATDLIRAVLLMIIPIIAIFHLLHIEYLYVIGFMVGICNTLYAVAYQSYVPVLVEREQLVEANSKLELSRSITEVSGPGVAGFLVQLLSGPMAIFLDVLSFLVSATLTGSIRKTENVPGQKSQRKNVWQDMLEGVQVVWNDQRLRAIAACSATTNFFNYMLITLFVLFVLRELGISAFILGLIVSASSVGGLVGALISRFVVKRLGLGPTIVVTAFLSGPGNMLVPLAFGPQWLAITILITGRFLVGMAVTTYNVNQVSLRQSLVPERLQGRMNASMRTIVWGAIPLGSLVGGFLGEIIGLRPTLFIAAIGGVFAFLWVALSPTNTLINDRRRCFCQGIGITVIG